MRERKVNLISVSGWDKLTEKQLVAIASLMSQPAYEKSLVTKAFLKINGLRVKRGYVLTTNADGHNFKSYIFQKNGYRPFTISANIFASMVKKMEWLEGEITLFRCLSKIAGITAPDHRLFNTTLEQFLMADNLYNTFMATRELKYLRRFVAVYYHKKGEKFNADKVEKQATRFRFAQKGKLFATFFWYTGVKRWLAGKYPYVFNGNGESMGQTTPDEPIMNILAALNQGDITRNEQIFKTHVHEALYQLNLMAEKAQDHV